MILFFYGQDSYRIRQKLNQLKEKFISSSLGDTNLAVIDGQTATFPEIARQILAIPFLSKKRLVIIEGILTGGKKSAINGEIQQKVGDFLKKVPESTVVVFVEFSLPDRRTSLFKKLNQSGQFQEFKFLEGENLRRFIRQEVDRRGGKIETAEITKLVEYVGNDFWRMTNELDKLIAYDKQITVDNIELLVQSQVQTNIFELIEKVAHKQTARALQELYKLLGEGSAEIYILTMIVYQYRNLLVVKDAQERGQKVALHPFVLGKTMVLTGKYQLLELKNIYKRLLYFESAIKVGKIESRLALELLVFELTR